MAPDDSPCRVVARGSSMVQVEPARRRRAGLTNCQHERCTSLKVTPGRVTADRARSREHDGRHLPQVDHREQTDRKQMLAKHESPTRSSTAPARGAMSRSRRWKTPANRTASCSPARTPPASRRRSRPASQSVCWREVRSRARCSWSAVNSVCRRCPTRSSSCCGAATARPRSTQWRPQSRVDSIG